MILASLCLFSVRPCFAGDQAGRLGMFIKIGSSMSFTLGGTVVSVPTTQPVYPGETILLAHGTNLSTTLTSVSDTSGNVWTLDQNTASGVNVGFFIARSNVRYFLPQGSTITITQAGSANNRMTSVFKTSAIVDIDTASTNIVPLNANLAWSGGSTKMLTQEDGLVFGGDTNNSAACSANTDGAGLTRADLLASPDQVCMVTLYKIVTSAGATNITGTWNGSGPLQYAAQIGYKVGGKRID